MAVFRLPFSTALCSVEAVDVALFCRSPLSSRCITIWRAGGARLTRLSNSSQSQKWLTQYNAVQAIINDTEAPRLAAVPPLSQPVHCEIGTILWWCGMCRELERRLFTLLSPRNSYFSDVA